MKLGAERVDSDPRLSACLNNSITDPAELVEPLLKGSTIHAIPLIGNDQRLNSARFGGRQPAIESPYIGVRLGAREDDDELVEVRNQRLFPAPER